MKHVLLGFIFTLLSMAPRAARCLDGEPSLEQRLGLSATCVSGAIAIDSLLADYDQSLRQGHDDEAKSHLDAIFQTLRADKSCFKQLSVYYAIRNLPKSETSRANLFVELYKRNRILPVGRDNRLSQGIFGAYDCEKTQIYFSPFYGPHDLTDVLIHESEHLVRDKYFGLMMSFSGLPDLTPIEYELVDETLAVISGAQAELEWSDFKNRPFDYTMFSENGDLARSMIRTNPVPIMAPEEQLTAVPDFLMPNLTMKPNGEGGFVSGDAVSDDKEQRLRNIIRVVARVYAPTSSYREKEVARWIHRFHFSNTSKWSVMLWRADGQLIQDNFEKMVSGPSPLCKRFWSQIHRGELNDYLGTRVAAPVSPGSEGTKPGSEGTKPGSEGTKPGSEGTKPGTVLRPCARMPSEF